VETRVWLAGNIGHGRDRICYRTNRRVHFGGTKR
jgi:hypothetical protein